MTAISSHGGTSGAFALALSNFKTKLGKEEIESFTAAASSMEDVRKAASAIQERQLKEDGMMRNMNRIQPLINGLQQFSGVIEVFVQSKPEVLALLWGPVKFLLQVASSYTVAYDKLMDAFQKIGENLSRFQEFAKIFKEVPRMQQVIVMIFEEILEFYQITLKYFRGKYWEKMFRSMWNTFEDRFGKILSNLDQHRVLLDSEAAAAHIAHVHAAIRKAQADDEAARLHRDKQDLDLTRRWLSPVDYDAFLARLGTPCKATGGWFSREDGVQAWLDETDKAARLLWLTGIPGSGKTFLSFTFLAHAKSSFPKGVSVAYAFLRDNDSNFAQIIRTLVAQLLHQSDQLLRYLDEKRESKPYPPSSQEELREILEFMLGDIGNTCLFIDGLDEIDIKEREMVLDTICFLLPKMENLRVFLSSRHEADILGSLKGIASHIRRVDIGTKNQPDIDTYVMDEGGVIFKKFSLDDDMRQEIQSILDRVRCKAEGMFLWARLVMCDLKNQFDMDGLEYAANNLPSGLDEAYGRILNRINERTQQERELAKRVLGWVMCSKRSLSLNELKQAMAIHEGDTCINRRKRILVRLDELCGPIVECDAEDKIRFVHFTVKEYIKSEYSARFIQQVDAHKNMAITCITYLSFTCFDASIEDERVADYVRSGEYCLHQYAESFWLDHVKDTIKLEKGGSWVESLVPLLERFVKLRLGKILPHRIDNLEPSDDHHLFDKFHRWPRIRRYLLAYHNFTCGNAGPGVTIEGSLELQISVKRFRKHLENIFTSLSISNTDKGSLQILHQYYGENIFKCSQIHCPSYVEGFDTQKKRDEHSNTHTRPIKCNFSGCDFESMGFATPGALKTHIQRYHETHSLDTEDQGPSVSNQHGSSEVLDLKKLLVDAISSRSITTVRAVLELDRDLHCLSEDGESVLHHALNAGNEDILYLLLEKGASPNIVHHETKTRILNSAILQGSDKYVQLLLDWGADPNAFSETSGRDFPLNLAAQRSCSLVKILLENGAYIFTGDDYAPGASTLIEAVKSGQMETVKALLEYGANVDSKGPEGETALVHAATRLGSHLIVRLLLEKGADANALDLIGRPALVVAAADGETEVVEALLEYGADVDSKGWGETALVYAAREPGSHLIFRLLLEKGADANALDSDGRPALILAVKNGETEAVEALLEYGANVDSKGPGGETALIHATRRLGSHLIVRLLLEKGADANALDSDGRPALILAVKNGETEAVEALLEYGANVDSKGPGGETALIHATRRLGSHLIVRLLLEKGADVNALDSGGRPALIVAVMNGETEAVEALLEYGADVDSKGWGDETALVHATRFGHHLIVRLLLEKGADANALYSNGGPALILAVIMGQMEVVEALLEYGANVGSKGPESGTALVHAAGFGHHLIVLLLLEKGADVNALDSDGRPALILAVIMGQMEVVETLLEYGANVDSKGPESGTALVYAAGFGHHLIVRLLLEKGADVNALDSGGRPALIVAVIMGQMEAVETLLEYGANVDSKGPEGETALVHAARLGSHPIVRLLLKKGADVNALDSDGRPAFVVAVASGQMQAVKALLEYGPNVDRVSEECKTSLERPAMGDFDLLKLLLDKGVGVSRSRILVGAIRNGYPGSNEVVEHLLEDGTNISLTDKNEALFVAAEAAQVVVIRTLLRFGADVNATDGLRGTPLIAATRITSFMGISNRLGAIEILLSAGAAVNAQDRSNDSALLLIAKRRLSAEDLVKLFGMLLKHNADPNIIDDDRRTALHYIARRGLKQLLEFC